MRWWQFGLIGGIVLSLATAGKFVRALATGRADDINWGEAGGFAVAIFLMGSICGLVVWMGRGLHRRIGMLGDAIVGVLVMLLFFTSCMLLFAPEMLRRDNCMSGAWMMLALGAVIGATTGPWVAHDWRKEFAKRKP